MRTYFFILFSSLFFSNFSVASPEEGVRVREFLRDIVSAGAIENEEARVTHLRSTFADHLDLIPLLMNDQTAQSLMKDSDLQWAVSLVTKENDSTATLFTVISDQLKDFSKSMAATNIRAIDLSLRKIQIALNGFGKSVSMEQALGASNLIAATSAAEKRLLVEKVPSAIILDISDKIDEKISAAKFSKIPALKPIVDEMGQAKINGLSQEDMKFLSDSFLGYFDHMKINKKRKIISAWIGLPPGTSMNKQLSEVLQNVGPVLQKIFQFTGRESKSTEMKELMQELLSDVRPFPTEVAKKEIELAIGRPISEVFSHFEEKPMKAGTIGQIYSAVLKSTGQHVVVKVKRPNLDVDMAEEFELFDSLTKENQVANSLIARLESNFSAELNFLTEADNLREAVIYNDEKLGIYVPKLIEELPPKSNFLVMEKVAGVPMQNAGKIDTRLKALAVYNSLKKWFEVGMYKTGFFHGDLHPGNMLIRLTSNSKAPFQVSFVDLGSAGRIPLEQRRQFLKLYAATIENSAELVVGELAGIGKVPEENRLALKADIQIILDKKINSMAKMEEILAAALQKGVEVDSSLVMFSRANLFLANELKDLNEMIKKLYPNDIIRTPMRAYLVVGAKESGVDIPKGFVGLGSKEDLVDLKTLRRLFMAHIRRLYADGKNACEKLFVNLGNTNYPLDYF